MLDKIKIRQAVIVEGRCDKNVLESVIDATIIPVNGFGVYKNKARLTMIRRYAESCGVILLTDSDNAGRQIRDYIKSSLCGGQRCEVHHLYVPNLYEVEDTSTRLLREAFEGFANAECQPIPQNRLTITRERLFDDGLIGGVNSAGKRRELLKVMNLPQNLSVNSMLDAINKCNYDYERIVKTLDLLSN
jgi:ribonuclease M5